MNIIESKHMLLPTVTILHAQKLRQSNYAINLKNSIVDTNGSDQVRNSLKNLAHAPVIRMHDQGFGGGGKI